MTHRLLPLNSSPAGHEQKCTCGWTVIAGTWRQAQERALGHIAHERRMSERGL